VSWREREFSGELLQCCMMMTSSLWTEKLRGRLGGKRADGFLRCFGGVAAPVWAVCAI
jgi:hypothetical protein